MKFLVLLLLLASCSSTNSNIPKSSKLQNEYLEQFRKLETQLTAQVPVCLKHTKDVLVKPVLEKQLSKDKYQFQFINPQVKRAALLAYDPHNFDWHVKGLLKNLYLSYPYDEGISQLHYENANTPATCSNDFDHLNFITALINVWEKEPSNSTLYQNVIKKYFSYVQNSDTPLIALLTLDHVVQNLYDKGLIKIKDPKAYKEASQKMELLYTQSGKQILSNLKEKNFKQVYKLDKQLFEGQQKFKKLIYEQISF